MDDEHQLQAVLPALPRYLRVARALAGNVAMVHDLTVEEIASLRLVVDEVCSIAVTHAPDGARLRLSLSLAPALVTVVVRLEPAGQELPSIDAPCWRIADGLTESLAVATAPVADDKPAWVITAAVLCVPPELPEPPTR